jgi:hypothetical protein
MSTTWRPLADGEFNVSDGVTYTSQEFEPTWADTYTRLVRVTVNSNGPGKLAVAAHYPARAPGGKRPGSASRPEWIDQSYRAAGPGEHQFTHRGEVGLRGLVFSFLATSQPVEGSYTLEVRG